MTVLEEVAELREDVLFPTCEVSLNYDLLILRANMILVRMVLEQVEVLMHDGAGAERPYVHIPDGELTIGCEELC